MGKLFVGFEKRLRLNSISILFDVNGVCVAVLILLNREEKHPLQYV